MNKRPFRLAVLALAVLFLTSQPQARPAEVALAQNGLARQGPAT